MFDLAAPASNTRPEEHTMTTATLTSVRLTAAARPVRPAPRPAPRPASRRVQPVSRPASRPLQPVSYPVSRPVSRPAGARRAGRAQGLVLTARGRRLVRTLVLGVATAVLAVGLVLAWVTLAASVAPGASAGDGRAGVVSGAGAHTVGRTVQVVVAPGDTLWQLAEEHAPGRDPRSVVADVVALNDLGSTGVQAGTTLLVPVG